ncbi:YiiX/YebB-like N1pC/P60 family cysteine hydrolase [Niabella drilacis]|uniref:YiiX/YebB-like N1pC/P60 family cysteine hydrolase n=1 Tax=Niabella drilacis (strain DSM 25811 / CCM 8410 / CCUG 62505 / LMG 26954 / E90) TaxID=1285928 RepID=UPI0015A319A7|nr:YiiX/YebB-like N1pC/P60 family cysteine hydrolase [Niabella drilacis]
MLLIAGCQEAQPGDGPGHNLSRELDSLKPLLRSGDLVLRNGTDATSQATRRFNRKDTSFSHCGIIAVEEGRVWVYHAIGGSYNPSQQLKKELLDSFSDPADNDRIAVYRYPLSKEEQQRLINIVRQYYKNRLPFDLFFNFETDDRMYCSEFVFKSINKSMDGRLLPIAQQQPPVYISIDDLFLNPYATLIKKIEYPILASP